MNLVSGKVISYRKEKEKLNTKANPDLKLYWLQNLFCSRWAQTYIAKIILQISPSLSE